MPQTVQLVNLGCAKNVVDSEEMLGVLTENGYSIDARGKEADVVVINTCGFIESAKQESIDVILEALERKKRGEVRRVVVAGCLAQRYGQDLARELPEVDAFLGTGQMSRIAEAVAPFSPQVPESSSSSSSCSSSVVHIKDDGRNGAGGEFILHPSSFILPKPHHRWLDTPTRVLSTSPWTAYLKISEGCDHKCTFCAIPSFRGRHASKPIERIIEEAEWLAKQGVKELNLIAQDSTQYGYDLYNKPLLPDLLKQISSVDGVHWIRLFYCYPSRVNRAVIEAIAGTPKVCQYIDMPLQHANDDILHAMRRPANRGSYIRLIQRFRESSPDVAIRTTFIVGFPGETEAHFDNLLRFVEEAQLDRAGVFEYSTEDGTPSANLPNRVPARIKRARRDRLMQLQQQVSLARNRQWVGREIEVLVESLESRVESRQSNARESGQSRMVNGRTAGGDPSTLDSRFSTPYAVGRSFRDGPEIDGQVYLTGSDAKPGDFVTASVTDAAPYDLFGTLMSPADH